MTAAPDADVEAILPYAGRHVRAMIELQRLAGMRPGEVCTMRTIDIDTTGRTWWYGPARHKLEHHGLERRIPLGPGAREILAPWMRPAEPEAYLFQPREAEAERRAAMRANRKSPVQPSQRDRRRSRPRKAPGEVYDNDSYRQAIRYAVAKLNRVLARRGEPTIEPFAPNQIRHLAADRINHHFDPDTARTVLGHALPDADLGLVPASRVVMRPVGWLWKYRLAQRSLALAVGDGGKAKSLFQLWCAARVSRGAPWPDGSGPAPLGSVIILSAEDDPEDTVVPRLVAAGADLGRIDILRAQVVVQAPDGTPTGDFMSLQDLDYWGEVMRRRKDCRLLIIDPLPSYLGRTVDDHRNNQIRSVLEPFRVAILEGFNVCAFCNTHMNKAFEARTPMQRVVGSVAYGNLSRNVHFFVEDPEDDGRVLVVQAKSNNSPADLPAIAYRVARTDVTGAGGEPIETAMIEVEPEPVAVDLHRLMDGRRTRIRTMRRSWGGRPTGSRNTWPMGISLMSRSNPCSIH